MHMAIRTAFAGVIYCVHCSKACENGGVEGFSKMVTKRSYGLLPYLQNYGYKSWLWPVAWNMMI